MPDHAPRSRSVTVLVVGAAVGLVLTGALLLLLNQTPTAPPLSAADTATSSTMPSPEPGRLDQGAVLRMKEDLESGEPERVANALGLEVAALPAEAVRGFETSRVEYQTTRAVAFPGGWRVPVLVQDASGASSEWDVTLAETSQGLVFVDSVETSTE